MSIQVWVTRNDVLTDITNSVLVQGCLLNYINGDDLYKYAPDLFSFSIGGFDRNLINYFLEGYKKEQVVVYNNDRTQVYFSGYLSPYSNFDIEDDYGNLNLTASDGLSFDLDRPCTNLGFRENTLKDIVENICTLAGVLYDFPDELDDITVPILARDFDEETYLEVLNQLLWEYGYTLYCKHALRFMASARTWFHTPPDIGDVPSGNVIEIGDPTSKKVIEPLNVVEDDLQHQIISVKAKQIRLYESSGNHTGTVIDFAPGTNEPVYQIHPTSLVLPFVPQFDGVALYRDYSESNEDFAIHVAANGGLHPVDGELRVTYFDYDIDKKFRRDVLGERDKMIVYAWDQFIIVYTEQGASSAHTVRLIEHYSKRSRLVLQNTSHNIWNVRGIEIRGSAFIQYGEQEVIDGINTEALELTCQGVFDAFGRTAYALGLIASNLDDFYNDWRLVSENGTNVRILDYDGTIRRATVEGEVSSEDATGTILTLISPSSGLTVEEVDTDNIYTLDYKVEEGEDVSYEERYEHARRFCEGYKNLREHGRKKYSFELLESQVIPEIGSVCVLCYLDYNINVFAICNNISYLPDDPDNPKATIELRKIGNYTPRRARLTSASYIPGIPGITFGIRGLDGSPGVDGMRGDDGDDGVDGEGGEVIYAITDTPNLPVDQRPSNSWGYAEGGAAGGLQWTTDRPSSVSN